MRSHYVAVPPREPVLWGLAAVVAGVYAAGIVLTADTAHPFELGLSVFFLVVIVANLVFDVPRLSLAVGCLFLGDVLADLNVLPELGEVGLSIWSWLFVLVGLAFLVQSVRSDASQHRFQELADGNTGTE